MIRSDRLKAGLNDFVRRSESAGHYSGDWIAGVLFILCLFADLHGYGYRYKDPVMQKALDARTHFMLIESAVMSLLSLPLLMSWKQGAWLMIGLQVATILYWIVIMFMMRTIITSVGQVIDVAMIGYCIARLRNAIGPPLISFRLRPHADAEPA